MSSPAWPLRVLVVGATGEETTLLEETLRRAGYDAQLKRVQAPEEFSHADSMACDVVLIAPSATSEALQALGKDVHHLPVFAVGEAAAMLALPLGCYESTLTRLATDIARKLAQKQALREVAAAQEQAQAALRESEERYRALVESTFDLVCELDSDGRLVYASPNYSQRLGFTSSELIGQTIFERIHPAEQDKLISKFANLMAGKPNGAIEFRHAHKNDDWVWLEGAMRSMRGNDGDSLQSRRVVLIARDVGERKRHERELASLISLAKAINAQSDLPAIARELNKYLRPLLPFDRAAIALLKEKELLFVGEHLPMPVRVTREAQPEHPAWQVIARGTTWTANRWVAPADAASGLQEAAYAFIKVPLVANGQVIGVLSFESLKPYVYTDEHARLAGMAGEQIAVAVHQVRLLDKALSAEHKYRALVQDVDAIVWEADPQTLAFTFVSPQSQAWLSVPLENWLGNPDFWPAQIHPEDRAAVLASRRQAIAGGEDFQLDYRVLKAGGEVLWIRDLGSVQVENGVPVHVRGLMIDITERKQFEMTLLERNTVLKAVQEAAADGICVMNNEGHAVSHNQRFVEMWPIPAELLDELRGKNQVMAWIASRMQDANAFIERMSSLSENVQIETRDEVRLKDGRLFESYSAPAMTAEGESFGRVWSFRDITARERFQQQLAHQAFHDPLTDLPNRALFMDRLEHAIGRSERVAKSVGVLFLDLDRFKIVNDSLGHPVGDQLLVQVAERISSSVRPTDTAARFGGDEFTVLVEEIVTPEDATQVAQRILEGLQAPFSLAGHEVHVSGSIGIALSTSPGDTADDLLRKADVAMYWSKNKGPGGFEVFDMEMSAQALERLQLEIDLRQAIKRDQLRLHYQPLVNLESGLIVGAEALIRWDHPTRGVVNPDDFIPIAEETGMILPIGNWVMRQACTQARDWHRDFPENPPMKISINLSAKQLEQPDLIDEIVRVLRETELEANCLELEITESVVMRNVQSNIDQLEAIKKLGVKLAIDDFGTGYSSLSYLEHFPMDALKIDRAFVGQIGLGSSGLGAEDGANGNGGTGVGGNGNGNGDGLAILKAVSTLGHTLGVSVTAEGIETAEQRAQLQALSCEIGQGFHFAKPLAPEALHALLKLNSRM